ncbi:hypothetical protein [Pseudomonas sp. UM16]|uniref:hypothetical protein n=1 Tax=Pseudomonas sp. UM16 TaxID=3158962 RepID=UPI0039903A2F
MNRHNDPNLVQGPGKPLARHPQSLPIPGEYVFNRGQSANESLHSTQSGNEPPRRERPRP